MKKNLVIGTGRGYSWYTFEPLMRSFLKFVPNAELVLFVDGISDFTRHCLENTGERVKLEAFPADLKGCFIVNDRWEMFLRYIEEHGNEYEQIFITDTRDVIFQDDVFKYFAAEKNFLGYTVEYETILGTRTSNKVNYQWLTKYFNKEVADSLADREIICCGTVIGTPEEMKIFLNAMIEYNPHNQGHGEDQVTMQYIIYNNLLPIKNLMRIDCVTGAILTAGIFQMCDGFKVDAGMILRGDGGIPAVVHQYDWQIPLHPLINSLYRAKDFHFDENFTDIHSALDQFIQLASGDNFEEAAQIFKKYLFGKKDFENFGDKILRCWLELLQVNSPPFTPEWEIIEISLQHALLFAFPINIGFISLANILRSVKLAQEIGRPVSALLKSSIYQVALNFLKVFFQSGNFQDAKNLIDHLEKIHYPFNKDFYIFKAGVYQKLGQYVEAEAAYKKAKEF